jgi:hypothetical protein
MRSLTAANASGFTKQEGAGLGGRRLPFVVMDRPARLGNISPPVGFTMHMVSIQSVFLACSLWIAIPVGAAACSWDNPIWPKNKRSGTPLFKYVIDGQAGYIDHPGYV